MKSTPARKRFGQNFLEDAGVIDRIERAVSPRAGEHLVEIGPGHGALTEALLASGCRLDAIELDRDLRTGLLAAFSLYPGFRLHSADALRFDFASLVEAVDRPGSNDAAVPALADAPRPLRIVGNLPYNISTPLIFHLLEQATIVNDMHFMLQREVVQRLAAQPGSGHWGRLGIMAQYQCTVEHLFDVPPTAFNPQPKVQSAVVRLTPRRSLPWPQVERARLARVVQAAFAQRRKTLRNTLKGMLSEAQLASLGIDPGARAETLSVEQFIAMAMAMAQALDTGD
jgi:16S rRNA (adenine1518-N6/adenine1519-N6)-dimethyltransferase